MRALLIKDITNSILKVVNIPRLFEIILFLKQDTFAQSVSSQNGVVNQFHFKLITLMEIHQITNVVTYAYCVLTVMLKLKRTQDEILVALDVLETSKSIHLTATLYI